MAGYAIERGVVCGFGSRSELVRPYSVEVDYSNCNQKLRCSVPILRYKAVSISKKSNFVKQGMETSFIAIIASNLPS